MNIPQEFPITVFSWLIFFEIKSTSDGERIGNNEFISFRQDGETAHTACSLMVVLRKVLGNRIIGGLSWAARSCDYCVILKENSYKNKLRIQDELNKLSDAQRSKFLYKNFRQYLVIFSPGVKMSEGWRRSFQTHDLTCGNL